MNNAHTRIDNRSVVLTDDPNWWRQASVYQIYPRSFADANGDGIGDLAGIASKVPYLKQLGVDAVWLSPFYPSALADGGYDVDDYRDVDPRIGTLADFDNLAATLHDAGIRIIVDIVPNHCGTGHEWFRAALAAPAGSPERARFHFRDGLGPDKSQPPTDWQSIFGGSMWEPVGDGQFYLHIFAPEQPDLNWDNPEIREDFLTTLRFWSDRGVDGFRVDVAMTLAKDLNEPLPSMMELLQGFGIGQMRADGQHRLIDREELTEIYAEWRTVFNEYTPPRFAVAEAMVHPSRRARYASTTTLGQAFNFDLLNAPFDAASFRSVIDFGLADAATSGSTNTWVFSNHDVTRHSTRYGLTDGSGAPGGAPGGSDGKAWLLAGGDPTLVDAEVGLRRATAATMLVLALPGSTYLYQGEELGLPEVGEIPDADRQDPTFFRNTGVEVGRDGSRVPLPWTAAGSSFGFGPEGAAAAHLPQPTWFADFAVDVESNDPASVLNLYRTALRLRHELQGPEELVWRDSDATVLSFERPGGWRCVTNFGDEPVALADGEVLLSSAPLPGDGTVPAATTVWLR